MAVNACAVVDALSRLQYDVLQRINRKFAALQRLAAILEELGDLTTLAPNLTALIPVESLDLSAYNQIAAACPFLHLPAPGEASLRDLKAKLGAAYANLVKQVLGHPWMRMGGLQDELLKFQTKINFSAATTTNFLACLNSLCAGFSAATGLYSSVSQYTIQKELTNFASGFVKSSGVVLTGPAQLKYSSGVQTVDTLKTLGASVNDDYKTVLANSAAVPTGPATFQSSNGIMYSLPPYVPPPKG